MTNVVPLADEVAEIDSPIADDVAPINSVYIVDEDIATADDIKVMTLASTEQSMHANREFSGGPNDQLVLTEYDDHVEYRL